VEGNLGENPRNPPENPAGVYIFGEYTLGHYTIPELYTEPV
jgi:hypothetical protein